MMRLKFFSQFATNSTLNFTLTILGLAVGLVSIIIAIYNIKRKKPVYALNSYNLINKYDSDLIIPGLKVAYYQEEIKCLTYTKLALWNAGRDAINSHDPAGLGFKVIGENIQIIDAKVIGDTNRGETEDQLLSLKYEFHGRRELAIGNYLNSNEGAVIKIIHTGTSSKNIKVLGRIRNGEQIKQVFPRQQMQYYREILIFLGFLIVSLLLLVEWFLNILDNPLTASIVNFLIVILLIVASVIFLAFSTYKLPPKLEEYFWS